MLKKYVLLLSLSCGTTLIAASDDEYDAAYFQQIDSVVKEHQENNVQLDQTEPQEEIFYAEIQDDIQQIIDQELANRAREAAALHHMLRTVFTEQLTERMTLKQFQKMIWGLSMGNTLEAEPLVAAIKKRNFESVKTFFDRIRLIATPETFEKMMFNKKILATALDHLLDASANYEAREAMQHILAQVKSLPNLANRLGFHLVNKYLDKHLGCMFEQQNISIENIKNNRKHRLEEKEREKSHKKARMHDPYDHHEQSDPYA